MLQSDKQHDGGRHGVRAVRLFFISARRPRGRRNFGAMPLVILSEHKGNARIKYLRKIKEHL